MALLLLVRGRRILLLGRCLGCCARAGGGGLLPSTCCCRSAGSSARCCVRCRAGCSSSCRFERASMETKTLLCFVAGLRPLGSFTSFSLTMELMSACDMSMSIDCGMFSSPRHQHSIFLRGTVSTPPRFKPGDSRRPCNNTGTTMRVARQGTYSMNWMDMISSVTG